MLVYDLVCPYVKNELLTFMYGKEFVGLQKSTNMIDKVDYLKVLDYFDNCARIYYVGKESSGNLLLFQKNNGRWQLTRWETIWSVSGSASKYIWPYFYHHGEPLGFFVLLGIGIALIEVLVLTMLNFRKFPKAEKEG